MSVKYEQSKDIMPFGHLVNGITCESETDRDENDSDVMNLRNHYTTQGHSDKKSTRIEHEEMQIVKPAQSLEQDIVIVATQKQSDKSKEMHGREESQCMTADQIDEQNNDIQSLKGTKERTNNEASRYISNNKKQTDSFENKKEVKCGKRICEKRKDNTAYPFSKERKQSKHNKDIQSLKAPREKTKHETPLQISNDKKPNESDELKQEMKCGKRIYEKKTKSTAYQFLTDKKQSGSVGQNKEIRCQKRTVTAHPISKPKKQKRSKGQDKDNKCLVRLCERNKNKTVPLIPIDNQKTESVKNSTAENRNIQKSSKQNVIKFDKIFWIIQTFLCYCMVLVVVDSYGSTQNGTWILNSTHVVFGERVVLRCTFETNICNKGSTRRWTKGKYQTFLINNGNSVNERKYREIISSDCFTSYLIITDFNQDDMGVQYTFAYSTMEFSNELKLERTGYISYPKNETTMGKISCEKRNLTLSLKLFDINPVPHCSMVIKNETISAEMNTKNTSEFLSDSEYIFQYKFLQTYKPEKLYVWCNFETRNITVFDEWFNCDDPKNTDKKDDLTVYVAVPLICMIIVIILVYFIYKWKKKIDKMKEKDKEKAVQYTALTIGGVGI